MKSKILTLLIVLISIINPAYSIGVSGEIKAAAAFFLKISVGVIISSIIIAIGLWIFSLFVLKKKSGKTNSKTNKFTCEIDDTKNMGEAINTFLMINK